MKTNLLIVLLIFTTIILFNLPSIARYKQSHSYNIERRIFAFGPGKCKRLPSGDHLCFK